MGPWCLRGAVALALAVVLPVAPADARRRFGLVYGGTTSQQEPFVLELARKGKVVDRATVLMTGDCSDGESTSYFGTLGFEPQLPAALRIGEHVFRGGRVSASGRFRAEGRGVEGYATANGLMTETIAGRVRRDGGAAGTYRSKVRVVDDRSGDTVATCDTGTVRWTARSRRGRIFAGATSQDQPIVVEVDRQRASVERMRMGWAAPCTPEETGSWLLGDELSGFRLDGGAFGDTFQQPFDLDGGGRRTFDYTVDGQLRRISASGSFAVTVTDADAAGAVTSTCPSGNVDWSARTG
jgi:hypothetical protein